MHGLEGFSDATREWFVDAFEEPTPAQAEAWRAIAEGRHTLVVAPTGSGKTLAAFLSAIDRLIRPAAALPTGTVGTRVLYISPLKALAVDVERNLRSPLAGIGRVAARAGVVTREVTVGVRSGDTTPTDRRKLIASPPDILITTPESLFLMLTSAAREGLRCVDTVIVDEIHAVAGTKRGAHLAVSLERLDNLIGRPAQRIGLSATVRPHEEIARFLSGSAPVSIVAPASPSRLELTVEVPVPDMTELTQSEGSIWPHVEDAIIDRVTAAKSTIVFANSRGVAERLTSRLNETWAEREGIEVTPHREVSPPSRIEGLSGRSSGVEPLLARAHHGSVSKEQRALIEDDLKSGRLRCVVATSSLELGIDMGAVDLVVQVGCPPSVASGLQRVGRAGHQVGEVSRAVIYPLNRTDLLDCTVTAQRMRGGAIEELRVLANPLDILAQHTVSAAALDELDVDGWFATVRRCAPFAALPRSLFDATLDLLAGRYPSDDFAELRPRVVWDRIAGTITGRPGAQRLAVTSGGTIPDRGMFTVRMIGDDGAGARVGELDEEMVYESRVGDVIALGATSWRVQEITHDTVLVSPAFGLPARLPFWKGDSASRPYELGEAIGEFTRRADSGIRHGTGLDEFAVTNLEALLREQRDATTVLPTDTTLVVERFRDDVGDWLVALLSPFGRAVHAPWALAVAARLRDTYGIDGSVVAADDGIMARIPDIDADPPGADLFVFEPDDLRRTVSTEVGTSALFASRFRECAARALLLPRRNPGARAPLWQQRRRAAALLDVARQHRDFPILLETARECLQDVYDLDGLLDIGRRIASRRIALAEVQTPTASPFTRALMFGYVGEFLYDGDLPLAERRAAALSLDPQLLAELLGTTDLRELLDPDVIEYTERELQRLLPDRAATGPEQVADLLRLLGPLSTEEVRARSASEPLEWLDALFTSRRIIEVRVGGEARWCAIEDAGRLRDALGTVLPPGIAVAHLESVADPLGDLVSRYARSHGPFTSSDVAHRLGLGRAVVDVALARLAEVGRVTGGSFGPGVETGSGWVDASVLRRLRSRSLAAARQQVEPVDQPTYARFLAAWQHVGDDGSGLKGVDGVLSAIEQLAGVAIPASAWETLVLPARVRDYSPAMLDELLAAGEVSWCGAGALAGSDGRVRLLPEGLDWPGTGDTPDAESLPGRLLAAMQDGGGAFLFSQLQSLVADEALPEGQIQPEAQSLSEALWQLAWLGRVSNDTFAPVRAAVGGGAHRRRSAPPRARGRSLRAARAPRRTSVPPSVAGRWYATGTADLGDPQASVLRAEVALDRYGVVTKGAIAAEDIPGGFAAMYRVLRELEATGACLRGYAVDGLGGAQFAAPGAIDRLRSLILDEPDEPTSSPAITLAATDPANPYGAALVWPLPAEGSEGGHRPGRKAGALITLHEGHPIWYLERGGRTLLTFANDPRRLIIAAESLVALIRARRVGTITIQSVDGHKVQGSAAGEALAAAGFEPHPKGLRLDG